MEACRATVCLLTPLGPGGLAAVRLFGPAAAPLIDQLFRPTRSNARPYQPGRLVLGRIHDPATGQTVDQAVLLPLPGGLGFELTLHGGVRIVQRVVSACRELGASRLSLGDAPGRAEFWRHAWLLNREWGVDEPAVAADIEVALPSARTRLAVEWLIAQRGCGLSACLRRLLGADCTLDDARSALRKLVAEAALWPKAIEGVRVAIVGPANAGKSSLLNALVGRPAAIVSDQPGTTRDYVSAQADIDGLAVVLSDTAGVRGGAGELEARASSLADPGVRSADLRLILLDQSTRPSEEDFTRLARIAAVPPWLLAVNKSDLPAGWDVRQAADLRTASVEPVIVSARSGDGLDELRRAIRTAIGLPSLRPPVAGLFNERQVNLAQAAAAAQAPDGLAAAILQLLNG